MTKKTDKSEDSYKEEIQKMYIQHQMIKQHIAAYTEQSGFIESKILELTNSIEAIKQISKLSTGSEALTNLGSQIFIKTEIRETGKVILDIGSGVYAEKTPEEAINILEKRKNEVVDINNHLLLEINKLSFQLKHIEPQIQKMIEKMQG